MAVIKSPTLYVKCSQFAFDELFEKFNKEVKQKQYKKFDYDAWCKIRKTIKEHCSRVDNKIVPTSIHFDIGTKEVFINENISTFHVDDKSFGQFLVNELAPQFIIKGLMHGIEVKEATEYVISTKPTTAELDWKREMTTNDNYYYKNIIKQHKEINNYYNDANEHYEKIYTGADKYSPAYATAQPSNLSWNSITSGSVVNTTAATATTMTTNTEKLDGFTIDWNAPTSTTKPITNTVEPDGFTINWNTTTNTTKPINVDDLISVAKLNTKVDVINPYADQVSICCDDLCKNCKNYEKKDNEEKENKMKGFNFDFGKITNDSIRMSMYGMAVKNASGVWTAYDKSTGDLMDVDVFNFDGSNFLFKMPVAIKDIAVGDVIVHARKPMFVISKTEAGDLIAIDPVAGEKKTIMPSKNMFGFNFATKVVSLFDNLMGQAPTSENPFGNMWMLMLMDGKSDLKDIMISMMLINQASGSTNTFNPMMLMLMNDSDIKDMAIPLMLMNQAK